MRALIIIGILTLLIVPVVAEEDNTNRLFIGDPRTGEAPLTVQFELCQQSLELRGIDEYISIKWYFGDGYYSEEVRPIHTYTEPGTYDVEVKITVPSERSWGTVASERSSHSYAYITVTDKDTTTSEMDPQERREYINKSKSKWEDTDWVQDEPTITPKTTKTTNIKKVEVTIDTPPTTPIPTPTASIDELRFVAEANLPANKGIFEQIFGWLFQSS